MKNDLHSRLTRLSPDDVLNNTALRGAVLLCTEAAERIAELEAALTSTIGKAIREKEELVGQLREANHNAAVAIGKDEAQQKTIERLREAIDGLPCYDTGACNAWPENDGSDWTCDACAAVAALKTTSDT